MSDPSLSAQKCEACHVGAPKIGAEDLAQFLSELPQWHQKDRKGVMILERAFAFKSYKKAVAFANKIAALAEDQGHHPEILLEWGKVTVRWWTHAINGLHKNDFICAAKTDALYDS